MTNEKISAQALMERFGKKEKISAQYLMKKFGCKSASHKTSLADFQKKVNKENKS